MREGKAGCAGSAGGGEGDRERTEKSHTRKNRSSVCVHVGEGRRGPEMSPAAQQHSSAMPGRVPVPALSRR